MGKAPSYRAPGTGKTLRLGPSEYLTDLATSEETGGHYTMYEVVSAQNSGVPLHEHDWDEAFYVLEGKYEISFVDDDEVRVLECTPGWWVHVPGNRLHAFKNANDGYSKMLSINQPVGLEPVLRKAGLPCAEPGAEPERDALPMEEFSAIFAEHGVRIDKERLAATDGVGAWKKEQPAA